MTYTDIINKRRRYAMSTEEAKRRAKKKFIAENWRGLPSACLLDKNPAFRNTPNLRGNRPTPLSIVR